MPISDVISQKIKQGVDSFIRKELTMLVADVADGARENSSWSTKIPGSISASPVREENGSFVAEVTVDLKIAPEAAAFEYGSGLHGKKGMKYEIKPKEANILSFPKGDWPNYQPPPEAPEVFRFGVVQHPGVKARPYLQPAIDNEMKRVKQRLLRAFLSGYRSAVPTITVIKAK